MLCCERRSRSSPMSSAFHATAGASRLLDPMQAGREAAQIAARHNPEPKLVLLFAASQLDQEQVLAGVREVTGATPVFGSSSYGEIGPPGYLTNSVVVAFWSGDFRYVIAAEPFDSAPRRAAFRAANAATRQLSGRGFDLAMLFCA